MSEVKSPFHRGEKEIQSRLGIREKIEKKGRRVIRDRIPEKDLEFFTQLPLLTIGTVDEGGRPWASLLVGKPGFVRAIDPLTLEVKARPIYGDPLNRALIEGADIGVLGLDFATRGRFRVNGQITHISEDAFEIRVRQAFPNCPQYIQARDYEISDDIEAIGEKKPVHRGDNLNRTEAAMIASSDTLFIASQFTEGDDDWSRGVDVSHRGGKPGFVIVAHESLLLFPDYAGNCMFSTLGNIQVDPRCGLLFIDFDSGNLLQLSGEAEVLWETEHVCRFPGAERVVSFQIEEKILIERALPLSWRFQGFHPIFENLERDEIAEPVPKPQVPMTLKSVNVSMPKEVPHDGKTVKTGIFKERVEGRVVLRRLNLEGDGQADLWGHGGAFRAVYVYSHENYDYWAKELGRDDFVIGQFGENFTVEGMLDDDVCVGDVFRIGDALVEVSQPRIPCYKLALKMGIEGFQKRFLESGRVGFYLRVLEEGELGAGDEVVLVKKDQRGMSVSAVNNLLYFDKENLQATRQALQIPALSHGWKMSFAERLAKAESSTEGWKGLRKFEVERKETESETITSFYLVPEDGAPLPGFLPGQFLTLELDIPGQPRPVIRTYSLSDCPNPGYYRLSIKREPAPTDKPDVPAGLSSSYFHDHVEPGTTLRVGAPR
ncbi:MAG: MOSC domain-containing protein, partial [Alphaproteobacteria bacterium]|nr:MOSC domain-containing protein [Alphaproteobacteria bacterium]